MTDLTPPIHSELHPARPETLVDKIRLHGTMALAAAAFIGLLVTVANAQTVQTDLVVTPSIPTLPGIREDPSPGYYYQSRPSVRYRPSAGVAHMHDPAPPNGCGPGKFEVLNPEPKAARCIGR